MFLDNVLISQRYLVIIAAVDNRKVIRIRLILMGDMVINCLNEAEIKEVFQM